MSVIRSLFTKKKKEGSGAPRHTLRKQKKKASKLPGSFTRLHEVLIRPGITEKAARLSSSQVYVFLVNPLANKQEIARAVQARFNVTPIAVRTAKVAQKPKRITLSRRRSSRYTYTQVGKKAYVTLKKGDTIQLT